MKRQSFNDPGHAHYLTFTCFRRRQLLTDDQTRAWLAQSIDQARRIHGFKWWWSSAGARAGKADMLLGIDALEFDHEETNRPT